MEEPYYTVFALSAIEIKFRTGVFYPSEGVPVIGRWKHEKTVQNLESSDVHLGKHLNVRTWLSS